MYISDLVVEGKDLILPPMKKLIIGKEERLAARSLLKVEVPFYIRD